MKIIKMLSQYRRDFHADMQCENCGAIKQNVSGYDDRNFHDNVIPEMKCDKCEKSRNDLRIVDEPTATRYESWEVI